MLYSVIVAVTKESLIMKEIRRNTKQQQIILEELRKLTSHPSASDLYQIVRKRVSRISLGTVYRNLQLLSKNGTIRKLDMAGREARFDGRPDSHYHIFCSKCGKIGDLNESPIVITGSVLKEADGWKILKHRIDFIGVCPECWNSFDTNNV